MNPSQTLKRGTKCYPHSKSTWDPLHHSAVWSRAKTKKQPFLYFLYSKMEEGKRIYVLSDILPRYKEQDSGDFFLRSDFKTEQEMRQVSIPEDLLQTIYEEVKEPTKEALRDLFPSLEHPPAKLGDYFIMRDKEGREPACPKEGRGPELFFLACTGVGEVSIISLWTGLKWTSKKVKKVRNITSKEFNELDPSNLFEKVEVTTELS